MGFRKLEPCEIEVKVKQVKETGCVLLLYKTARTDMDLLDEEFGPERWICDYKEVKGNLYCGIGVDFDGKTVWKWDCGTESRADGEGNEKKGEASDAFKRAGFRWGIGRELYSAPFIWVNADKVQIRDRRTYDRFSVEKILYDESGKISALAIRNDTMKKRAFVWQAEQT